MVAGAWATVRPSIEWVIVALLTRVGALSIVCAVGGVVSSACPTDTCAYHQAWRWLPTVPSTPVVSEWAGVSALYCVMSCIVYSLKCTPIHV